MVYNKEKTWAKL